VDGEISSGETIRALRRRYSDTLQNGAAGTFSACKNS